MTSLNVPVQTGMPLPGNRRGTMRRRAILKAARELFLEQGFDPVTIDAIVARAGGSKATIYSYFGSKEGLFTALMAEVHSEIGAQEATDAGHAPPRETLTRIVLESLRTAMSEQVVALYRIACAETHRFPQLGQTFWHSVSDAIRKRLAAYIMEQATRGRLNVADPDRAAAFLQSMVIDRYMIAVSLGVQQPPSEDEAASLVTEAVSCFLAAHEGTPQIAVA